jgi:hypothetical protein
LIAFVVSCLGRFWCETGAACLQIESAFLKSMLRPAVRHFQILTLKTTNLGVRSSNLFGCVYLRMDPTEKLEAVEAVVPPELRRGRFKAPDALIASLLADISPSPA